MELVIRHATASDVAKCFELWRGLIAAEAATSVKVYPQPNTDDPRAMNNFFTRYTAALRDEDVRYMVAELAGEIVGYTLASHMERAVGEPRYYIFVEEMFIKPHLRGTLVYKAFEEAVEEWAKELKVEMIECAALANDAQTGRWTSRGFTPYMVNLYRKAKWKEAA